MRGAIALGLFAAWASIAAAQDAPRVDGEQAADAATVILNEVNTESYPDVLIIATVLQDGAPVTGLREQDFRVREDEVDQEPLTVEPQLPPLSVVVALDSSGSMSKRMAETREAAKTFVQGLDADDSVQLLRFSREIDTPTPMTSTKEPVIAAIETITARGDTALYDAIFRSVDLLADRRGRKAVVVLSDGVDDDGSGQPLSTHTVSEVLARAGEVNVPIFAIGLGTEMDEAVLRDIAETTGAQYLSAPEASELDAVYARIGDQLSGQYAIRYTSSLPADGIERRVDLAALGTQDSKLYTPLGSPAKTANPSATSCQSADAIEAERPDLEQAKDRYQRNLISVTDRNALRDEAAARMESVPLSAPIEFACALATAEAARALYDDNLIAVTTRNSLRASLVEPLAEGCAALTTAEGQVECLTFFRDAYQANAISVTDRNELRKDAFDRLVEIQAETQQTDDALAFFGALYQDNLISVTDRNAAREALLRAEE